MAYYPILIEYKGYKDKLVKLDNNSQVDNRTVKNEPNYKNINAYAMNCAVHYVNALLQHTSYSDIIAVVMTGFKNESEKSNFGIGQKIGEFSDLSFLKKENVDEFIEKVKEVYLSQEDIDKLKEQREIDASLVKLNNYIYQNEKGLSENDRVYLVAASIIATLEIPGEVAPLEKSELKSLPKEATKTEI